MRELFAAALSVSLSAAGSAGAVTVTLHPGDDIQAAVDSHPGATTFQLTAGVYRLQSVLPKGADSFIGDDGAILNGAEPLDSFDRQGGLYVARHQPIDPNTQVHGECTRKYPRCDHPQDLYFDGKPLRAVDKRSKVGPGKFFYDYAHEQVFFADDPAGHVVELSVRPFAIGGAARDVRIENLIVENYACADQQGALGDHGQGRGWSFKSNEVRWNHGVGIVASHTGSEIFDNFIHHNGELGLGAGGGGSGAVNGNEVAFNAWNGTDCEWECGGAKWADVTEWIVSDNYVHDNQGDGFWIDIDARQFLFENNRFENNRLAGLSIEISNNVIVENNLFAGNGARTFNWGWNGQVQIQNSHGVTVEDNTLVLDPRRGGNGIVIIQQNRGAGHMPANNTVTGNDITLAGGEGAIAGWFADYRTRRFAASNRFDNNRYHVHATDGLFWAPNEWTSFSDWQATGQDIHSTVDTAVP